MNQGGGIIFTPFSTYQQQTVDNRAKKEEKKDIIKEEIVHTLRESGLPSDVDNFLAKASKYLNDTTTTFFSDGSSDYKMADLIRLRSLANKIKHSSALHKTAVSQLTKEGAGSELALTNTGGVYVRDSKGNIKVVSASDLYSKSNKYSLLTNADLINLRERDPELANQDSILTDLANTVGMKSINDYVKGIIASFGKETTKDSSQYFTAKEKDKIQKGFEQILGMAPDGSYKIDESIESMHQGFNSAESLQAAVNYIYRSLPRNMRNVLRANVAAENRDPNDINNLLDYVKSAVLEHTTHNIKKDMNISVAKDGGGGIKGSGVKDKLVDVSPLESIATGRVVDYTPTVIAGSKSRGGLQVLTQQYPMQDKNGNIVGQGMLADVLEKAEIGNIVDKNSITFGDKRLKDYDLTRVMYDGTSTLNRA